MPFIETRLALILAAWFAASFFKNLAYEKYISRGYFLSPRFFLDIWARWDSEWYLSIVETGYVPLADLTETYSNLAFFPLYPITIKLASIFVPGFLISRSVYLVIGIILSNLFFIGSLILLYKLIEFYSINHETAQRTIILLILFPASFFFSCFYPESLFLFLSLSVFYLAARKRWFFTCLCAALLTITRPQGVLVGIPLAWMYMDARQWSIRKIRADVLWLLLLPVSLSAYFYYIYRISGNFFASIDVQGVWGRNFNNSFQDFFNGLFNGQSIVSSVDSIILILFIILGIWVLLRYSSKALGIYALLMVALPLMTGTNISMSRHMAVIFPVFILMGDIFKSKELSGIVKTLFFTLQIAFMIGWVNYYWIA